MDTALTFQPPPPLISHCSIELTNSPSAGQEWNEKSPGWVRLYIQTEVHSFWRRKGHRLFKVAQRGFEFSPVGLGSALLKRVARDLLLLGLGIINHYIFCFFAKATAGGEALLEHIKS